MATHVSTTTTTTTSPTYSSQVSYGHPTPVNSATTTPVNNSPTSPRVDHPLPLHNRQARPANVPLYVPAALRPTERPPKSSPPTPPRSVHGSPGTLTDGGMSDSSRRSTMDANMSGITKMAEDQWMKHEHLGEVTGLPTRDHWKVSTKTSVLWNCRKALVREGTLEFIYLRVCRNHVLSFLFTPRCVIIAPPGFTVLFDP
jgi:hypothetical protein